MSRLVLLNKPYGFLSQFTPEGRWRGLADLIEMPSVYVAGRLDADSEGLLLLTDDGALQARIADPRYKLPKTYWAQVEGEPTEAALEALRTGVPIGVRGVDFTTRPAQVRRLSDAEVADLWPRDPPIRFRKAIPTAWLEIVITEGKNRQVRRMTAHVGLPILRLIRRAIGAVTLDGLQPGAWREMQSSYADLVG
jgi:23S rRNA pseudouridine2457 synthase